MRKSVMFIAAGCLAAVLGAASAQVLHTMPEEPTGVSKKVVHTTCRCPWWSPYAAYADTVGEKILVATWREQLMICPAPTMLSLDPVYTSSTCT